MKNVGARAYLCQKWYLVHAPVLVSDLPIDYPIDSHWPELNQIFAAANWCHYHFSRSNIHIAMSWRLCVHPATNNCKRLPLSELNTQLINRNSLLDWPNALVRRSLNSKATSIERLFFSMHSNAARFWIRLSANHPANGLWSRNEKGCCIKLFRINVFDVSNSPKLLSNSVCFWGGDNGRFGRTFRTIFEEVNSSRRTSLVAILLMERIKNWIFRPYVSDLMTQFASISFWTWIFDILRKFIGTFLLSRWFASYLFDPWSMVVLTACWTLDIRRRPHNEIVDWIWVSDM